MAWKLSADLSAKGYLIVSGLGARDQNGAAQKAALEGGAAAVLAGGLNHI